MFTDEFDPKAALDAASCPGCNRLGLTEITSEAYEGAPPERRYQAQHLINPSVAAQCPACGLVMEWPGCVEG